MNEITFDVLKIIISVAITLIMIYAVPYLKALKENEHYAAFMDAVEVAVCAAEQTIKTGGKDKKEAVMLWLREWATTHGIQISTEQISQLVEAAVFALKHAKE